MNVAAVKPTDNRKNKLGLYACVCPSHAERVHVFILQVNNTYLTLLLQLLYIIFYDLCDTYTDEETVRFCVVGNVLFIHDVDAVVNCPDFSCFRPTCPVA